MGGISEDRMRETMHRTFGRKSVVAAAAILTGISSAKAAKPPSPPPPPPPPTAPAPLELNNQFFDWTVNLTPAPPPSYLQSPFLDDSNVATVNAFLASLHSSMPNQPLAVKIQGQINTTTANTIF